MMNRRTFTLSLLGMALLPGAGRADQGDMADGLNAGWTAWKAAFLHPSGRVVDALQGSISHSEGQGYALVLAALLRDRQAFEQIDAWTSSNLAVRDDALLAWRWSPDAAAVTDLNNASDGDLFYAWGLVLGAEAFGSQDYLERAGKIARDLAATCILPDPSTPGRTLFLPAAAGFTTPDGLIVNPSYYMPRAMREVADAVGQPALAACAGDGEALLAALALGGPVPDWVEITASGLRPADGFSATAGYEALRVPLFLIWSGLVDHPAIRSAVAAQAAVPLPPGEAVTVFNASGGAAEFSPDPGYRAISALAYCAVDPTEVGSAMPDFSASQAYYPATLQMFTMVAQRDQLPRCFPI